VERPDKGRKTRINSRKISHIENFSSAAFLNGWKALIGAEGGPRTRMKEKALFFFWGISSTYTSKEKGRNTRSKEAKKTRVKRERRFLLLGKSSEQEKFRIDKEKKKVHIRGRDDKKRKKFLFV